MNPANPRVASRGTPRSATWHRRLRSRTISSAIGLVLSGTFAATLTGGLAAMLALTIPSAAQAQAMRAPDNTFRDETDKADLAIETGKYRQAIAELDKRIASQPRDVQARFKRATLLARVGRDDDAIKAFTQITQTYPELPEPYNNLAALYAKHGRYQEARAALETALAANPNFALARRNLGDIYLRLAADTYARASQQDPRDRLSEARLAQVRGIITNTPADSPALAAPRAQPAPARRQTTAPPINSRGLVQSMGGQPPIILPENDNTNSTNPTTNSGNVGN